MPREDDDDLFDVVSDMADRIGMKGRERRDYIDEHMRRAGYRPVQTRESYARQEGEDNDDGGGFFGRRQRGNQRSRPRRRDDDDDF
jgi:hypothetical protein